FWGRFRRAILAADAQLDASIFDYDDVLVTLLGDVAATYIQMRTIQQQIEYVRQNMVIQTESLEIAQARFQGGLTSELDVEQATSQLAQTESLVPQFHIQLRHANDRLCVLLGIPTKDLTRLLGEASIPKVAPDVVIGIPAQLLTRRPDIRRAERNAAAQCEQIGIAEANLYPQIAISGTIAYDAEHFNQLFNSQSQEGTIGPKFQWNILNYGRLINAVRLQEAKYWELATHYRNVVLQANAEVEDGLVEFLQSQLQAKSLGESVDAAQKAVQLSIIQYRGGLTDFNRVALLQQNLVQQQDLYAQSLGDIGIGLVRTYRALGGGWEIRCNPAAAFDSAGAPPESIATPREKPDKSEELPPGKMAPGKRQPSTRPPKVVPKPDLQFPESVAPKGRAAPELKETAPGELIKPDQTPPRSAPTKLPDLEPETMPDEDVFGPGKAAPKSDKPKSPIFDQPNPPPADDVFGPANIPTLPPRNPAKPDDPPTSNDLPKAGPPRETNEPANPSPPMSHRRAPPPWQVRPAAGDRTSIAPQKSRRRVQHAGLLPEDRGEIRRLR
ncbi:MAG: efflux transporter outer membrane subunit, partial [Pirellulales bacterium]|nr:efflux transporter outer membrane subunit [Pirellulales bacterium]